MNFEVERDERGRLRAQVAADLAVAIQCLPETDHRRIERGVQAFAIVDLKTSLGPIRIRNVHIVHKPSNRVPYQVRWYKHAVKGTRTRQGQHDYLDVAGPLNPQTRKAFQDTILELFHFIRKEAEAGNIFPLSAEAEAAYQA